MQSPTHTLIALALLGRRKSPLNNRVVFIGSIIPDAFIYIAWVWLTFIKGETQTRIWDEIYFDTPMQVLASLFNSVPLYIAILGLSYICLKIIPQRKLIFHASYLFAVAALIHIAFDAPVHAHDAYAYFQPFTDWRFYSPFSYYEQDHHAVWVSTIEIGISLTCIILLWRRFPARWIRGILTALTVLYSLQFMLIHLAPVFFGT